jgi:hypothetical protein
MRVIRFPSEEPIPGQEEWLTELDAALDGTAQGPTANAWRELRADVRSLTPTMTPVFERRLREDLEQRGALRRSAPAEGLAGGTVTVARPRRIWPRLAFHRRSLLAGALAMSLALVAAAVILSVPRRAGTPIARPLPAERSPAQPSGSAGASGAAGAVPSAPSAALQGPAGPAAPGRVQQLAASLTLASTPAEVQATSDAVAQLVQRDGGYVQSSNVQVSQQGASEATLALRLPSARLSGALAAIGRLAAVRAESQSLQDITDGYNAARQRLDDALAEQRALLRALAAATSEGQIASLRQRLAGSRAEIARARASLTSLSQRASTAEVEVTVLGDVSAQSEGLTLHRGLRDAGHVLLIVLIAILVLGAVLAPLALLLTALAVARGAWHRHQRERVLGAR